MKHRNTENRVRFGIVRFLLLFLTAACSTHPTGLSPAKRGLPGQTLDAVVAGIREEGRGDDTFGSTKQPTFEVFLTGLPNETGQHVDAGLVTLTGATS